MPLEVLVSYTGECSTGEDTVTQVWLCRVAANTWARITRAQTLIPISHVYSAVKTPPLTPPAKDFSVTEEEVGI